MENYDRQISEEWRSVQGYEGIYKISNFGRVFSEKRKLIMSPSKIAEGYLGVTFRTPGKRKTPRVHRLVAIHFIDNPENKPEVNHIDGDKTNNHYKNLEWCTRSENMKHAFSLGLNDLKGENGSNCKLTEREVKEIRFKKENGAKVIDLMKEYGISSSNVRCIIYRKTWKHILKRR